MKLTQKFFLFFFVTLFATGASVYFLSERIFLANFERIEDQLALNSLHRIPKLIEDEANALFSVSKGWSSWDGMYFFMAHPDPNFLRRSFETPSFFDAQANDIFIINAKGKLIYSNGYDLKDKKFVAVDSELNQLVREELAAFLKGKQRPLKGLFITPSGRIFITVVSSILDSEEIGPDRGYTIFLRQIDQSLIAKFSDILKTKLSLSTGSASESSQETVDQGVLLKSTEHIQGLISIPGVMGKRKVIARIDFPRTLYLQGRTTILSFMVIIGILLAGVFALIFFGFKAWVLNKIFNLKEHLNQIGQRPGSTRIAWKGHDEIAELTQNINEMLERLESSQNAINRASKFSALGEVAGNIAHEVNNPLAIIVGYCNKLMRLTSEPQSSMEEIRKTAERIEITTHRIDKIIKSLRLVSRDGHRDPKLEYSLGRILDEVITLSENKLQAIGVELRLEKFDRELTVQVRLVQIVQVLLNLLSNSVDALADAPEKWIEIQTTADNQWIHINFIDSGRGIDPEIADKILSPFFTTKGLGKGTGLGLSISKNIIESHDGQFSLIKDSAHTCFRISLPRALSQ